MILTLTPNPSLDLLFSADRLVWNDANRIPMPRRRVGGQGINVVRAALALEPDATARAIAPLGGPVGDELRRMLEDEGTPLTPVPIDGETRIFVGVRESASGRSLLLNPRGPRVGPDVGDALLAALDGALESAPPSGWVAGCGSLLPGMPLDFYAELGRRARRRGFRFVPDCDGPGLAAAVETADLLVPNDLEASRLVGRVVDGPVSAAEAGRRLLEGAPDRVVVTLGGRGAVCVTGEGAWWACPHPPEGLSRPMTRGSAVGAGDAFLAALLLAGAGSDPAEPLAEAVAAGSATLLSRDADLVTGADAARVRPYVVVQPLG